MFRSDPKPIPKVKKSFGFEYWNNIKKKSAEKKKIKMKPEDGKLDLWFRKIYDMADGCCAESGRKLQFDKKYCAHLLPKNNVSGGFPYFKFDLRNGILLDWRFHSILDRGSAKQRTELKTWEYISLQRKMLLDEVGMNYDEHYWLNMSV